MTPSARRLATAAMIAGVALLLTACAAPVAPKAWQQPPPQVVDRPVVAAGKLHHAELDNGLALIVLEDRRLPRVSLGLSVRRGAALETLDEAGVASFTASLMKRGAGSRDALSLATAVDELGASLGASSGWDSMGVHVSGLSRDLDPLLEILADVVLRPGFDLGEAERTRGEILATIERARDNPGSLVSRNLASVLYPGVRAGLPRLGTAETVANLGSEQARAFHERVFVPNNAVFFAAGDVDADALLERVGAGFGSWMAGAEIEPGPPLSDPAPAQPTIVVVDRPDLAQAHIALAHEGIARTDPRRVEASLVNSVVGGSGFSSRLMRRVRSEAGLTYGVSSGFTMRRGGGIFSISTSTRVSEARRVIDLVLTEIDLARSEPPTSRELEGAKALAIGGFSLALETSDAVVGALVDLDLYGLPPDSLDTYRPRVRAATIEGSAELARALLHPERFAVVVVGPAAALTPQLEGLGPIEIRQP